jgi:hypothetical protein
MVKVRAPLAALIVALALSPLALESARAQEGPAEDGLSLSFELSDMNEKASEKLHAKDYEGAIDDYRKVIDKVEKSSLKPGSKHAYQANAHYNIACAHSLGGKKDEALAEFATSVELGFWDWKHIEKDTDLDAIRNENAFKKAIETGKAKERERIDAEVKKAVDDVKGALGGDPLLPDYDFDVETIEGKPLKLAKLKGKVVIVTWFWPSIADEQAVLFPEVRRLVKLRAATDRKDVEIIGICMAVNYDADGSSLAEFMKKRGVNFPVAKVTADKIVNGAHVLFIDRAGKVRANLKEPRYEVMEAITKVLVDAASEPGTTPK